MFHGCTRLAVKLDFIAGLLLKAVDVVGTADIRGVQAAIGEVIAWRNMFWGLTDAMARTPVAWAGGTVLPNPEYGPGLPRPATVAYPRVKELTETILGSGLIYLNSHAVDFQSPELRPYLDRYLRGSNGTDAVERIKLMKLLWDAMGTEFGGRHELYERNYAGAPRPCGSSRCRWPRAGAMPALEGLRRAVHGRVRPRRLDRARPHQPRRREPVPEEVGRLEGMTNDDTPVGRLLSRREVVALLGFTGAGLLAPRAAGAGARLRGATAADRGPLLRGGAAEPRRHPVGPRHRRGPLWRPLQLALAVSTLRGGACTPLAGAVVDVWHCDALGAYSDVRDPGGSTVGQKFLRGAQTTDTAGLARFTTIYPGAYAGRAVHIHFKVRTGAATARGHEFTSQIYFDDALTDQVHALEPVRPPGSPAAAQRWRRSLP